MVDLERHGTACRCGEPGWVSGRAKAPDRPSAARTRGRDGAVSATGDTCLMGGADRVGVDSDANGGGAGRALPWSAEVSGRVGRKQSPGGGAGA